jgi:signal transduction histidine kinase
MRDGGIMTSVDTIELADLVKREHTALLDQWRAQVRALPSARLLDTPTLNDHIPNLIEELATALRSGSEASIAEVMEEGTPPAHGEQRYQDGFDIEEVVSEYNILRACVHDLAERNGLQVQGKPFHILNRVLDGAIGAAVQAFAAQRAREVQRRREEYLAFVAHDLRTPLNAIGLVMGFLERSGAPRGQREGDAEVMWNILRRNVRQLESLVGKILVENVNFELEAGLKLEQRMVDLWALVETVRLDLQPVAEAAETRMVNDVPEEMLAFVDASMVRRIFQNLMTNAISYAPGGEVRVSAKLAEGGHVVECRVQDDGTGIPPHRIEVIFEKMEADPGNGNGSGLGRGLAIVKALGEAHGGTVAVESEPGQGACFCFTLPAAPA